jgi:hypothetical protein
MTKLIQSLLNTAEGLHEADLMSEETFFEILLASVQEADEMSNDEKEDDTL